MWYIIMAILAAIYFIFINDNLIAGYLAKMEQKNIIRLKGNVTSISQIRLIKGIPDIAEGTDVAIILYSDKISIDDKVVIPLNRVKEATTFSVRGVSVKRKNPLDKITLYGLRRGPLITLVCFINRLVGGTITQKVNLLSINYINRQGQQCNGLFNTGNKQNRSFANAVNKQINTFYQ